MSIHTSLTIRTRAGAGTEHLEHDSTDLAAAHIWIRDHLPATALLVLLNIWTEQPHTPPRDIFHAAGPATTITAELDQKFSPEQNNNNSRNIDGNASRIAAAPSGNNCSPTTELLDWMSF
ncbi:hypothetical protein [Aldersonia kunmingensis]|uniref:hypothetical protein n=1 Tax=Aldersonia kunmingensis TaxID=408066 RepID=UPI00082BAA8B|nr:hypothetical protein [Aldersonia kunmingensis]